MALSHALFTLSLSAAAEARGKKAPQAVLEARAVRAHLQVEARNAGAGGHVRKACGQVRGASGNAVRQIAPVEKNTVARLYLDRYWFLLLASLSLNQ